MSFFTKAIDVFADSGHCPGRRPVRVGRHQPSGWLRPGHPASKSQGIKQLMAGGGVALIGITLIPLLSGLLSTT